MKATILLPILFAVISSTGYSQAPAVDSPSGVTPQDGEVFYVVDQHPEFPGGMSGFYRYVSKNMVYPKELKKQKIRGKVLVEFVIDTAGMIMQDSVRVVQKLHPTLDQEAVRLVKESPEWTPGYCTALGEHSAVRMILPIVFGKQ